MNEADLKRHICKQVTAVGGKVIGLKCGRYMERGTPDLIACLRGRCIVIEAKVGDNKPSEIQQQRMDEWERAGALVVLAREDFDIQAVLDAVGAGERKADDGESQ